MTSEDFDFIIVGGGLAGLVLATRLSEDPHTKVLVIEAGEDMKDDTHLKIPALWPALINTDATWMLKTTPQEGLGGRELVFPQGRMVGGSSGVNSLAFSPTSKANVEAWVSLGNPGWEWSNYSEALKKSYTLTLPSSEIQGNGPLRLTYPSEDNGWPKVWRDTISALGFPVNHDPLSGEMYGGLTIPDTINPSTKERSFAGNDYLELAKDRPNLTLWTRTLVDKILFDKASDEIIAVGVQFTKDGQQQTVNARKEVLITAGALNSPKLLELSGIGDKDLLQSLGIDVVIDNPHVGENLQNHPMCSLNVEVTDQEGFETLDGIARKDPDALVAAIDAYSKQSGPFSRGGVNNVAHLPFPGINTNEGDKAISAILETLGSETRSGKTPEAFIRKHESFVETVLRSPTEPSCCYMTSPSYGRFTSNGLMASAADLEGEENYVRVTLLLAHPLSRGSVHINSASSSSSPNIDPGYLTHPLDVEVLAHHLQFLEKIISTEPLASHVKPGGKRDPTISFANLDDVRRYVRESAVGACHFTGTCSMMPREMGGVVSPQLRVYGCRNLRVCDASIIPITPRTNTQASVYGVAELAAEIIKSGL